MAFLANETEMVENLLVAFNAVSDENVSRYAESYRNYNKICESLSIASELPIENIAAAFAWLSPQQSLSKNVEQLAALVDAYCEGGEEAMWNVELSQYPSNVENAIVSLLDGPCEMLWHNADGRRHQSKKVRSFFRNIMLLDEFVTIDRHAVAIAIGNYDKASNGGFVTIDQPRGKWYDAVRDAYRHAAACVGLSPAEFQAVVWCDRRGSED